MTNTRETSCSLWRRPVVVCLMLTGAFLSAPPASADDRPDAGACEAAPPERCCVDDDCAGLGDACTGPWTCKRKTGEEHWRCVPEPDLAIVCDTSEDGPCRWTACDPESGECLEHLAPRGAHCGEDNECTIGECVDGECMEDPISGPCDDGDDCTTNDKCSSGRCVGRPKNCKTGNPCIDHCLSCRDGFCQGYPGCPPAVGGPPCDDGDPCTEHDRCLFSYCIGTHCKDQPQCFDAQECEEGVGCVTIPGTAMDCNDDDPCTLDSCDYECRDVPDCDTFNAWCVHDPVSGCVPEQPGTYPDSGDAGQPQAASGCNGGRLGASTSTTPISVLLLLTSLFAALPKERIAKTLP